MEPQQVLCALWFQHETGAAGQGVGSDWLRALRACLVFRGG